MSRIALGAVTALLLITSAGAQTTGTPADHDALRKLKADIVEAVNKRDYPAAERLLHKPFAATLVTQDHFTDFAKLKDYYESLYTRPSLRMKTVRLGADADDLSQIFEGTFAVNRGTTKEFYELADGRSFEMAGRWTAISIKDKGTWKVMAVHTGVNFMDNPVISAIESAARWFGIVSGIIGLAAGFAAGWFFKRANG
jgi:ketosteroid isomerase-like protein